MSEVSDAVEGMRVRSEVGNGDEVHKLSSSPLLPSLLLKLHTGVSRYDVSKVIESIYCPIVIVLPLVTQCILLLQDGWKRLISSRLFLYRNRLCVLVCVDGVVAVVVVAGLGRAVVAAVVVVYMALEEEEEEGAMYSEAFDTSTITKMYYIILITSVYYIIYKYGTILNESILIL